VGVSVLEDDAQVRSALAARPPSAPGAAAVFKVCVEAYAADLDIARRSADSSNAAADNRRAEAALALCEQGVGACGGLALLFDPGVQELLAGFVDGVEPLKDPLSHLVRCAKLLEASAVAAAAATPADSGAVLRVVGGLGARVAERVADSGVLAQVLAASIRWLLEPAVTPLDPIYGDPKPTHLKPSALFLALDALWAVAAEHDIRKPVLDLVTAKLSQSLVSRWHRRRIKFAALVDAKRRTHAGVTAAGWAWLQQHLARPEDVLIAWGHDDYCALMGAPPGADGDSSQDELVIAAALRHCHTKPSSDSVREAQQLHGAVLAAARAGNLTPLAAALQAQWAMQSQVSSRPKRGGSRGA